MTGHNFQAPSEYLIVGRSASSSVAPDISQPRTGDFCPTLMNGILPDGEFGCMHYFWAQLSQLSPEIQKSRASLFESSA